MARSLWLKVKRLFRPETETYETRRARPGTDALGGLPEQYGGSTDQRRHGGTGATGATG